MIRPRSCFHRVARAVLLHEAEHRAAEHDQQHDAGVGPLGDEDRHRRGKHEDQDERAAELIQEQRERGVTPLSVDRVATVLLQPPLGLCILQALRRRAQLREQRCGRDAPVGGSSGSVEAIHGNE